MKSHPLKLVRPDVLYETSFRKAFSELKSLEERKAWIYLGDSRYSTYFKMKFRDYVANLLLKESTPVPGFVCDTVYWAVQDGEVVGRLSLRHELNRDLLKVGGHIGYIVRPSARGRGLSLKMLQELLRTDRAKSMQRLLLSCDEGNIASEKTIVRAGGELEDIIQFPGRPRRTKRFWITL